MAVDVVTHSVGGLVAKAAIEGVNRYGVGKLPPDGWASNRLFDHQAR
ncbi:hypothetical protein AB0C28_20710 [Nonomuraea sp. NPDC048892]